MNCIQFELDSNWIVFALVSFELVRFAVDWIGKAKATTTATATASWLVAKASPSFEFVVAAAAAAADADVEMSTSTSVKLQSALANWKDRFQVSRTFGGHSLF